MLIYGTAINRKDKLRDVLVHTVFQIMGMAKIVERVSFHRRSSSGLRTARETEDETRRGGVRKEKKEKQKKTKKKGKGTVCLSRYGRVSRCTYYICFNLV